MKKNPPLRTLHFAGAMTAALLLAGCVTPPAVGPQAQAIDKVALNLPASLPAGQAAWPTGQWWTQWQDPQLDRLITHALEKSPNLAAAQARIARAQSAAGLAQSNRGPQVNGSLDLSYGRFSENHQVPRPPIGKGGEYVGQARTALDFSYDLDLWGKNAALIDSAKAQLRSAEFDRDAARLALSTSIARSYAQLAAQAELHDLLQLTLKQRTNIRELAQQRVTSGLDTRVEVMQSTANEAALRAEMAQLETAQSVTRLQIAALAGDMPAAAEQITRPALAKVDVQVPASLPLDLLGRRPELAAQRAKITAAVGDAAAARAQFYPNINLAGFIGLQSFGLGQLLSAGSLTNSVGPAIRLPIFEAGRLRANYGIKAAEIDLAVAQYNQSVLSAAQDVAEQLTRLAALEREERAAEEARAASQEAHRLAMLRYQGGLSPYLSVLSVETQLLAQRRVLSELHARRVDLQVGLVRALGGGFQESAPALASNIKQ